MVGNASGDDGGGKVAWERGVVGPLRLRGVGTGWKSENGKTANRKRKSKK